MAKISDRLSVDDADDDDEYLIRLTHCGEDMDEEENHFITRAEADALIDALSVRDASGRIVAPPQDALPIRPSGPWDRNTSGE